MHSLSEGDRRNACFVVEFHDPEVLHLAYRRGANAGSGVEQNDIVESMLTHRFYTR